MKCIYCGAELKEGCIYCSNCGREVQLVPDYNIIEDDYLKALLEEENRRTQEKTQGRSQAKPQVNPQAKPQVNPQTPTQSEMNQEPETPEPAKKVSRKQQNKKTIIIISVIVAVCVIGIIAAVLIHMNVKKNQENSVDYQIEMAKDALKAKNEEDAIAYYEKALKLDKKNVEVRLALGAIYMDAKDYDEAEIQYKEVLKIDSDNKEAYKNLIAIYAEREDYDAITRLSETTTDSSILDLFADYIVTPPVFGEKEGKFDDYLELKLSTKGDYEIYYTIDGTDPEKYGTLYSEAIPLDEMRVYEVKAVCKNDKGIYSDMVSGKYEIEIPAPDMPVVSPDGGDFGAKTSVTVSVPDGCKAYYTWDGTNPNENSSLYTAPIEVPEGNNVLSVILIDEKTKQSSIIYRGNFIYITE